MAQIALNKVSKIYEEGTEIEMKALIDADFKIDQGEFVAIMGPSGSGKSTLMHIIGLLDRPTRGEYQIDEMVIDKSVSERQLAQLRGEKIGFVFQTFNLLPRTSALYNVMLPTMYHKRENRLARAKKVLKDVGLEKKLYNKPSQLSGGERQRVAIARALINNPQIILADEPTGNLDSKTGHDIINIFQKLNKEQNVTIVLITHDAEVARFANRVIKIKDGKIEGGKR